MSASEILKQIRTKLKMKRPQLCRELGFSNAYIWILENNQRQPGIAACKKIIKYAKEHANMDITIDMLVGD